jgi:hypothetical protein
MSKHNIEDKIGHEHVTMKQIGGLVFAARVSPSGVYQSVAAIWEYKLRRGQA